MIFRISFKNIWRNKVRSLIVITAITLGLTGAIFSAAIMSGMVEQKIRSGIDIEVSHFQLHNPEWMKNNEPQYYIKGADSIAGLIRQIIDVKAVAVRTRVPGMISSPNSAAGVQIIAIDPEMEKKVTALYTTVCDSCGTYFKTTRKNQILIGAKLAEKLKVRVKSKVVVRFQGTDGNIIDAAFSVCGIFQTSNTIFNEMNVFVRESDFNAVTDGTIRPHEIAILLKDNSQLQAVQSELKKRLPLLEVKNWMEIQPEMALITSAITIEIYVILGIILFALAFGIVNTMLMVVFERTRELGMLMAVGMSKTRVFKMIMLETVFLTLIGGIVGMVVSGVLIGWTSRSGIDLSSFSKGLGAFGFDSRIYPFITTTFYFNLVIMIISTGVLSAIAPARKALKLKPVEAIRVE